MRNPKVSLWFHWQLAKQSGEILPGGVSVLMSPEGWRGSPQTEEAERMLGARRDAEGMLPSPCWEAKQALEVEVAVAGNLLVLTVVRCISAASPHQCFTQGDQSAAHLRNGKTEAEREAAVGENSQIYPTADEAEHTPAGCLLQLIPLHTCSSAQPGTCEGCFPPAPSPVPNPAFATSAKCDSVGRGGIAGRWLVRNCSCNIQTCEYTTRIAF